MNQSIKIYKAEKGLAILPAIKRTFPILTMVLFLHACTSGFEEINQNPNSPQDVSPQFLLTNVLFESADANTYDQGFRLANYLAQFAASVEYERIDRYEMGGNSAYWNQIFQNLTDLQSMKSLDGSNVTYEAVGDILSCFLFSQLTDMWGDVPYTEALQAKAGNFTPKYDEQQAIYTDPETGILAVLKRAGQTLEKSNDRIQGDIMFSGNTDKWIRLANSLRLRYLLRISNRIDVSAEVKALAATGKLITSNADNAVIPYLSVAPNQWPMSQAAAGLYQEHRMTHTVDSILTKWNDPRIGVIYKPTEKSQLEAQPRYVGLLNGMNRETISDRGINLSDVSLFGAIFRDIPDGVDAQFMQSSEVLFLLAEAAERNMLDSGAETYYEAGIHASFEYYGLSVSGDYLNQEVVKLNGTNNLEKILTQKWFALLGVGHEAWFDVRRTGIPMLKPGPDNLNEDRYPARYLYPESEQATNLENYQAAVSRMGADDINTKCWWQK